MAALSNLNFMGFAMVDPLQRTGASVCDAVASISRMGNVAESH